MTLLTSSKSLFQELVSEITAVYEENEAKTIVYLILNHFLELSKSDILFDEKVSQSVDFQEIIKRLKRHEPIQYIIGETEFYGRKFKVTPDTLIPRPETEELVQLVVGSWQSVVDNVPEIPFTILDIGTGTGCIAISLACELPDARLFAYDISEEALRIAKENAEINGANVTFERVDILKPTTVYPSPFSVIVSNPPYVMNSEKAEMEKNVLNYEPHLALFVEDNDPLIFYKKIAKFSAKNLTNRGLCIVEINQAFGLETAELFWNEGFRYVEVIKDMFGKDRFVKAIL